MRETDKFLAAASVAGFLASLHEIVNGEARPRLSAEEVAHRAVDVVEALEAELTRRRLPCAPPAPTSIPGSGPYR